MKKAVALGYEKEKKAPEVLAKGFGAIADKIIEVAEECGIEIIKDAGAADILSFLDEGDTIPEDLYELVAEIYMFLIKKGKVAL